MFGFPIDPDDPNIPEPFRSMLQSGIAQMERAEDSQHALADDKMNRFWQFMSEMNPEQLATFREMILTLLHSPKPTWLANRIEGQIDAIFRFNFPELCRNCGRASCGGSAPHLATEPPTITEAYVARLQDQFQQVQAEVEDALKTKALMAEYNVVPRTDGPTPFKCGNCGVDIISLEDRMRREPGIGGCSGCMAKSRNG